MTKVCPNCKSENSDNSGFCQNCGTELSASKGSVNPNKNSGEGIGGFWNNQSKGGKIAIGIGVCCIGLIILFAIASMASPDKNTTTAPANTTATTTPVPATTTSSTNTTSSSSGSGTQVQVTYSGSWTGNYGDTSGSQSVDGKGTKTFTISGDPDIVSAVFQKSSDSSGTLTVNIIKDGQIVETKSTSAAYGVVTVSHSFM